MSDGLFRLEEELLDLDVSVVKGMNKEVDEVLRGVLTLDNIPEDDEWEFQWKARCLALLKKLEWEGRGQQAAE